MTSKLLQKHMNDSIPEFFPLIFNPEFNLEDFEKYSKHHLNRCEKLLEKAKDFLGKLNYKIDKANQANELKQMFDDLLKDLNSEETQKELENENEEIKNVINDLLKSIGSIELDDKSIYEILVMYFDKLYTTIRNNYFRVSKKVNKLKEIFEKFQLNERFQCIEILFDIYYIESILEMFNDFIRYDFEKPLRENIKLFMSKHKEKQRLDHSLLNKFAALDVDKLEEENKEMKEDNINLLDEKQQSESKVEEKKEVEKSNAKKQKANKRKIK